MRNKVQFFVHDRRRVDGTSLPFLGPGWGALPSGADLPTAPSPEPGRPTASFCAFTPLLPPGLQLFYVISVYINASVIYI